MDSFNNFVKLVKDIDLENLNISIINRNIKKLFNIFIKIKPIWNNINSNDIIKNILNKDNKEYLKIKNILKNSILSKYKSIEQKINNINNIYNFTIENVIFSYINIDNNIEKDYNLIYKMIKITLTLSKYKNIQNNILIIWLPIKNNRDFNFNEINCENLKICENNFEAFTCSGVTFGTNPRTTIITRYEEVEKLLVHEIIHNIGLDGSFYHKNFKDLISQFKLLKSNNFDYEYSIYESYTELLSTYFMILFNNIFLTDKKEILKKIRNSIIIELVYSYNIISNLIKLNNSKLNINSSDIVYQGNICFFEYYYLKGLMYNNYILEFGDNEESFYLIYKNIINMLLKIKEKDDKLLIEINNKYFKNNNFKYTFLN